MSLSFRLSFLLIFSFSFNVFSMDEESDSSKPVTHCKDCSERMKKALQGSAISFPVATLFLMGYVGAGFIDDDEARMILGDTFLSGMLVSVLGFPSIGFYSKEICKGIKHTKNGAIKCGEKIVQVCTKTPQAFEQCYEAILGLIKKPEVLNEECDVEEN